LPRAGDGRIDRRLKSQCHEKFIFFNERIINIAKYAHYLFGFKLAEIFVILGRKRLGGVTLDIKETVSQDCDGIQVVELDRALEGEEPPIPSNQHLVGIFDRP
jgi:hypothetical protein